MRVSSPDESARLFEFRGGLRRGLNNATWPDATLRFDSERLAIHVDGPFMDDVGIERSRVTELQSMRGLWSRGLRIQTVDGQLDGVIYWTAPFRHRQVVTALRQRGWPVSDRSKWSWLPYGR